MNKVQRTKTLLFAACCGLVMIVTTAYLKARRLAPPALVHKVHEATKADTQGLKVVFMLHGYGANEEDLFDLYKHIPNNFMLVSVRAPFEIQKGSYKWYDVDFNSPERKINTSQLQQSIVALKNLIRTIQARYKFQDSNIYLVGFSQGAMLSYSMALLYPESISGMVALSGRMGPEIRQQYDSKKNYDKIKILILHGKSDQMIQIEEARSAKLFLESKGFHPDYHEYEGLAHSINNAELLELKNWLGH